MSSLSTPFYYPMDFIYNIWYKFLIHRWPHINISSLIIFRASIFFIQLTSHCLAQKALTVNLFKYLNKEILYKMAQINIWEATIGSHPFSLSSPVKSWLLTVVFSWVTMTTSRSQLIEWCQLSAATHLFYDSTPHPSKGSRVFLQSHRSVCKQNLSSL